MKQEVMDIIHAPTHQWKYTVFFQTFSVDDLQEALDYMEAENRKPTENRRNSIRTEIERRKKIAADLGIPLNDVIKAEQTVGYLSSDFRHAPLQTRSFIDDWNETCLSIYQRIQFMPPIPIVRG